MVWIAPTEKGIDAVDKELSKDSVGLKHRFPLELPRTENAYCHRIQLSHFASKAPDAHSKGGRARFVTANSASDARCSEQEAGILSAYDELIENSQRRLRILESMARALYRKWFVHFRFPGHMNCAREASALGETPKAREITPFGEMATITIGLSPKGDTYNENGDITPLMNGPVEFGNLSHTVLANSRPIQTLRWPRDLPLPRLLSGKVNLD
jgi:hypothetical protein